MTDLAPAAPTLDQATTLVAADLTGIERLGVAFSGGVDSSVLLALAARVLGHDQVVALLGISPSLATAERSAAHTVARQIGVEMVEIETHEGERAAYRANGPDRCYHCKDELFATIDAGVARSLGLDAIAYGENADDTRRPDRPGARAATEHHVRRPLAAAGLTKADVRAIARDLGLEVADKPASPCLASRILHFEEVTPRSWPRSTGPKRPCVILVWVISGSVTTATSRGSSWRSMISAGSSRIRCAARFCEPSGRPASGT